MSRYNWLCGISASNGAVVLPIPVEGKEKSGRKQQMICTFIPGYSTNRWDGIFTRLGGFGVNLDQYLPSLKLNGAVSGLVFRINSEYKALET